MTVDRIRNALRSGGTSWAGLLLCSVVALGGRDADGIASWNRSPFLSVLFLVCTALVLICAIVRRFRYEESNPNVQRGARRMQMASTIADLEVSLALIAGVYAVLTMTGGHESTLYPVLYGLVAFSATFQTRAAVAWALVVVLIVEATLLYRVGSSALWDVAGHVFFAISSVLLHGFFFRGLSGMHRRKHNSGLHRALRHQRESAQEYRLVSVSLPTGSRGTRTRLEEEQILKMGSVEVLSASMHQWLSLLQSALDARSCVLLWLDSAHPSGTEVLKIKAVASDCDAIRDSPAIPVAGVLKAVVRDRKSLVLPRCKTGQVAYYEKGFDVGAFIGAPILDGKQLCGVLCIDRSDPFGDYDRGLAESTARQIAQSVRVEQVFNAVERSKYEHERFYHASSMLCEALTLEEVQNTAFEAIGAIVDYDVAVITVCDKIARRHRVDSIRSNDGARNIVDVDKLRNLDFSDNSGLVSMVVKNKHYLPTKGSLRDGSTSVFDTKVKVEAESLVVFPLLSADETIGTMTLASRRKEQFRNDTREMLGVICSQVAVSMQNARMYKRMETMATTDGLTNLANFRSFQERFGDLLERSQRHGHQAAVLLCDIDYFKKVNDTYGHPVGDEVLRRVAQVLRDAVRKIDIPARYGGEEFAVVLEATDLEGALRLAERIREDVGQLELESEKGPFQITISTGVSSFPGDGDDTATLIERADAALYHAKECGRNRVVCYRDLDAHGRRIAS